MAVIEIFDTEEEQTQNRVEPKTAKTPKTTKPRTRSKKSVAAETASDAAPVEAVASQEQPVADGETPPVEAEKKPARKPRARKKPVEAPVETLVEAPAVAPVETPAPVVAASPELSETPSEIVPEDKPKRTRRGGRGRKRVDAPEAADSAAPVADEAPESVDAAPQLSLSAAPELLLLEAPSERPALESAPELTALEAAPELAALEASPEKVALEATPEQPALENTSRRAGLPALTEFSPAPNAPTLILPQSGNSANDSAPSSGETENATPSKSRSRSARRRKAARKRAEAAALASQGTGAVQMPAAPGRSSSEIFDAEGDEAPFTTPTRDFTESEEASEATVSLETSETPAASTTPEAAEPAKSRRSRSRRGRGKKAADKAAPSEADDAEALVDVDEEPDYDEDNEPVVQPRADRKMLVSVLPGELVEVVITDSGRVQEYYVEMEHQAKIRGNIYKGVVSNIDVNLQAAFVNYGNVKNGFLQIDEVHPEYWLTHHEVTKGHKYPPIQKVMKPGQEVLVQVVKEPNGAKGAFLTTWVSLAGRFLVLTPGQEQIGISRKVEDGEERNRLRELIKGLNPGEGLGAIVRTVSAGTSKTTLQKDLSFLKRVWKDIRKRAGTEKAPSLIYKEPSLATRAVRDYLSDDVSEVWVDDAETAEAIRDMTTLLFPRKADLLHLYQDNSKTLWERFKVRKDLDQIHAREVLLPSGGRLVFDQTEALMAIDINSGKTGGKTNFESMALRTNVEAAEMIAHQLRLRDIGGQVVIDFIEMRDQSHCREVEKTIRNAMKGDRARYDIGKMSSFGLMQIVRQRIGSSAISISQEPCPHCTGTGLRRNMEWQSLQVLRDLRVQLRNASVSGQAELLLPLEGELALYILNHKRERLCALEKEFGVRLEIRVGLENVAG